jgi:hypothetical protein
VRGPVGLQVLAAQKRAADVFYGVPSEDIAVIGLVLLIERLNQPILSNTSTAPQTWCLVR